jgi:AIG2-like family
MTAVTYFAYGSNMSSARLRDSVRTFIVVGVAELPGHLLRFHKRSKDGTAKCNVLATGNPADRVVGVVFRFAAEDKRKLDVMEGLGKGYDERTVEVVLRPAGTRVTAVTYAAARSSIDDSLKPTEGYRNLVLDGAEEHDLPADYVDRFIRSVATVPGPADSPRGTGQLFRPR